MRMRSWMGSSRRALLAIAGVLIALGTAEAVAGVARDRAFPYLNIFVADPTLGVRLATDSEARVRSRLGRITTVATNRDGFRGPEWTPAREGRPRVLVLGDSQAMGLHVEWTDTFAARLATEHHIEALDAAVPTWGPAEHLAILDELAPRVRPTHVVLLLTVGNDWHEAGVPNTLRTTERDGWAIRPSLRKDEPADFPLRSFLLGRSHLVYAARQLMGHATAVAPLRGDEPHRLVRDLDWLARPPDGFRSRLGPTVRDLAAAAGSHGVEPIVVTLPLDVQVHAREWAKYRERPLDTRATEALATDLLADADALDVPAIDLLWTLRAASPGAFLPDDPHLSPRGHAAVATAIAEAVRAPSTEARR